MTDNEIIKALECAEGIDIPCLECSYKTVAPFPACRLKCVKDALDLINRQKAEIERLYRIIADKDYSFAEVTSALRLAKELLETEKSEAIKEFAENVCKGRVGNDPVVIAVKAELDYMLSVGLEEVQE